MSERVIIFDTTLRDGEQSPGASMNVEEKLRVAQQLAKLKVDVIEAGFPISSEGDFEAVKRIAEGVEGPKIAGLARTNLEDIDRAWEALKYSSRPRIHTFIATSDIHLKYKLAKTREEVLKEITRAVAYAKRHTEDVEFSAEDATRTEERFLVEAFTAAIEAGATTINIPDTVGYTVPYEYGRLIRAIKRRVPGIRKALISVHCHDDLGLAVANSVEAIRAGARQVECTINGIGERAGNTSLEELVMLLRTRKDVLDYHTDIQTEFIYPTSRLLSRITGMVVQPNKAIVGANAFAHEAGIHQAGVLKKPLTYEIMTPESVGVPSSVLVMGKHSGRHAFRERVRQLGYELSDKNINRAFVRFKSLADRKKEVYDEDIEAIIADEILRIPLKYELCDLSFTSGTFTIPSATVELEIEGKRVREAAFGDGPVDAVFKAIKKITSSRANLAKFMINAVTGGADAQGEVNVRLEEEGVEVMGQGAHTDIVVASARAFLNALNKLAYYKEKGIKREVGPGI